MTAPPRERETRCPPFLGAALSFLFLGEAFLWRHAACAPLLVRGIALLFVDRGTSTRTKLRSTSTAIATTTATTTTSIPGLPPSTRHTHAHGHGG